MNGPRAPSAELKSKLMRIALRPQPLHASQRVVLPDGIAPIAAQRLFQSEASNHVLELGCGWGEFCVQWLLQRPDAEYVAFEIKSERIRSLLRRADRAHLTNLRIVPINFGWFLEDILPQHAFDRIIVNFPDPWPKRRHWKHRLVQPEFPERIEKLLRGPGSVFIATDYGPYARRIQRIFRASPLFEPALPFPHYRRERPGEHPPTRFEHMHAAAGRRSYYTEWRRKSLAR